MMECAPIIMLLRAIALELRATRLPAQGPWTAIRTPSGSQHPASRRAITARQRKHLLSDIIPRRRRGTLPTRRPEQHSEQGQHQPAQGTNQAQESEERHPTDDGGRTGVPGEGEREAQDETVEGAGRRGLSPARSVAQSEGRESPGDERPPVEEECVGRGPAEQETNYDSGSEPWHGSHDAA